ncbi:unnamed protein product, partial [Allacma fusca]
MTRPPGNNPNMIAPPGPPSPNMLGGNAPPKLIHMRPGNKLLQDFKNIHYPKMESPTTPIPIITSERPLTEKESVLKALETLSKVNSDVIQSIVHEKLGVPKPSTTATTTATTTTTTTETT